MKDTWTGHTSRSNVWPLVCRKTQFWHHPPKSQRLQEQDEKQKLLYSGSKTAFLIHVSTLNSNIQTIWPALQRPSRIMFIGFYISTRLTEACSVVIFIQLTHKTHNIFIIKPHNDKSRMSLNRSCSPNIESQPSICLSCACFSLEKCLRACTQSVLQKGSRMSAN